MRIILLAGYKPTTADNCPWLEKENGVPRLEQRMRQALQFTQNCIVVLAGDSSDEALRVCPSLERCELIFDTVEGRPSLLSNLRAALQKTDLPAIVLPAELEFGDMDVVKKLTSEAVQQGLNTPVHVLQSSESSFPLVLTVNGCQEVARNKKVESLADPRLNRQVPCL